MAKDEKKRAKTCGVSMVDGKIVCDACQAEVPQDEDCPTCKRHVDWDRVRIEIKQM